jgi:hypothetical protein
MLVGRGHGWKHAEMRSSEEKVVCAKATHMLLSDIRPGSVMCAVSKAILMSPGTSPKN